MELSEKAIVIEKILDELFPEIYVPLNHLDPYTLLVAVVLSAQSTDKKVNSITPQLFSLADDPYKMVKLDINTIKDIIKPIGLSVNKSKAIHELSTILIEKYNGIVPASFEDLEALPGVGHKTASVVMSQAFGFPAFPVDTHIHRLAARWGLSSGKNVKQTEYDLKNLFPENSWNKLHLQIIFYGREYCPARGHDMEKCTICSKMGLRDKWI
jgi:endonuclease III